MKYKLLLTSKTQRAIDDFYYAMNDEFECLTTSLRNADVIGHLRYYVPDAVVYFVTTDTKDAIMSTLSLLEKADQKFLKVILIGDRDSKDLLTHIKTTIPHIVLLKPITTVEIRIQIRKFLEVMDGKGTSGKKKNMLDPIAQAQYQMELLNSMEGPKRILVIDDDPLMLNVVKSELKNKYQVATAISGKTGLKFLESKTADLILLDYEMPGEDGPAVLEKLRADEITKHIPVVFLTGINSREKIEKVLAMKPHGYLLKPIQHDKLITTIQQIIG